LLRKNHYDACFAHMQPLFAIMAAPLLLPRRIPITLWYTHKAVTPKLRLAEALVQRIVTASPEGFRIPSAKVRVVGHGIDTEHFVPAERPPERLILLSVSRIRPAKHLETMIEAADLLRHEGLDFCLRIVGEAYDEDRAYAQSLRALVAEHGLEAVVHFAGAVPHHQILAEYQQASLMFNLSSTGSVDKAVLEAMACGLPVITANEAFRPILPDRLLIPMHQPQLLADRIREIAALSQAEQQEMGSSLRQIVMRDHSLSRLAALLAEVFRSGELPVEPTE
jgi:glycosyltransferase involved in cell wall biosynthesis